MSTALVFGASGFLGRHVRTALASDAELFCPRRRECDLAAVDPAALAALLREIRPDIIVNCAGRVAGTGYDLVRAHTVVTAKLIEAVASGAPDARLVRIGSAAEYGLVPYGHAVREDEPALPISEYGVSHLAATRLAELAGRCGRVDAVVLRVFNPVGPGLPAANALGRAVRLLRAAMARGEEHLTMGLVDSHRDFVDVRDVALAVRAAALVATPAERVFNIGSGQAVPTRHAVELLAGVSGLGGVIRDGPLSPNAGRSAAVPWMCADTSRSCGVLGWAPTYDLIDSVKALWAGSESWTGPASCSGLDKP